MQLPHGNTKFLAEREKKNQEKNTNALSDFLFMGRFP